MEISREISYVIMVINKIYLSDAENLGISLSLKSEVESDIQFPPSIFINIIQITGNLVSNAIKLSASNSSVEVLFSLVTRGNDNVLKITLSYSASKIYPHQVIVNKQLKEDKTLQLMSGEEEIDFLKRLKHVVKLVNEEGAFIKVKRGSGPKTILLISFPLEQRYMHRLFAYSSRTFGNPVGNGDRA